jgi:hypothetical protein
LDAGCMMLTAMCLRHVRYRIQASLPNPHNYPYDTHPNIM